MHGFDNHSFEIRGLCLMKYILLQKNASKFATVLEYKNCFFSSSTFHACTIVLVQHRPGHLLLEKIKYSTK